MTSTLIQPQKSIAESIRISNDLYMFIGSIREWETPYSVSNISQSINAVITLNDNNHEISVGDSVGFNAVDGMSEINNLVGNVLSVTSNEVTIDIDTTTFTAFGLSGSVSRFSVYKNENTTNTSMKRRIVSLKRVFADEMRYVIKHNKWESGILLSVFDSDTIQNPEDFTVIVDKDIFICVAKGPGVTTHRPVKSPSNSVTYNPDGYAWMYLQTIDDEDFDNFADDDWVPIKTTESVIVDEGQVLSVNIESSGIDYSHLDTVIILGDGNGATASIERFDNLLGIVGIRITNPGSNYTWAEAIINTTTGSGNVTRTIVNPGLRSIDPARTLNAKNIKFRVQISGSENGEIFIGDIASVGLIHSYTLSRSLKSDFIDVSSELEIDDNGLNFNIGTKITGQVTGSIGYITKTSQNSIKYIEETGSGFIPGELVTDGIESVVVKKVDRFDRSLIYSSDIIYLDNFNTFVTRNENQIDQYEFTLGF